jgi:hypothetical protein
MLDCHAASRPVTAMTGRQLAMTFLKNVFYLYQQLYRNFHEVALGCCIIAELYIVAQPPPFRLWRAAYWL